MIQKIVTIAENRKLYDENIELKIIDKFKDKYKDEGDTKIK